MVQRNSQALNLPQAGYGQVQQVGAGTVGESGPAVIGNSKSGTDRVLQTILGETAKVGQQYQRVQEEEAYLNGASKAGQIESEEVLQADPMTRDWAVAGYRDTMGRLKIADAEAQFTQDMQQLREQDPEKLQEYLAKRRADLTPTLEGMSREQRAGAFGQLLLNDRAAIAKHTAEHGKFIVEQRTAVRSKGFAVANENMTQAMASENVPQLDSAVKAAAAHIFDTYLDPALPQKVREGLTVDAVNLALANGNLTFYRYLQNTPMPGGDTLLTRISSDDQVKLANTAKEVVQHTRLLRNTRDSDEISMFESQRNLGTYKLTYDEAVAIADKNTKPGGLELGQGWRQKWLEDHLSYGAKNKDKIGLGDAYLRGDSSYIFSAGKNESDAATAFRETEAAKGTPVPAMLQKAATAGRNGHASGYKIVGEFTSVALNAAFGSDGKMLPQHVETLRTVGAMLDEAERKDPAAANALYSGMSDDTRMRMVRVRAYSENSSVEMAFSKAVAVEATESKMTGQERAEYGARLNKDIEKLVLADTTGGEGFWARLGHKVPFFGNADKGVIAPQTSWFKSMADNPRILEEYNLQARAGLQQEIDANKIKMPLASADEIYKVSLASLSSRTIPTASGPLFLPKGQNLQQFFGVNETSEGIGKAIDSLYAPKNEKGRLVYSVSQGKIRFQEYVDDQPTSNKGVFEPTQVKAAAKRIADQAAQQYGVASGPGKEVVGSTGVKLRYSGVNVAGVDDNLMLSFRDNLVKFEDVRDTVYEDSKGNKTIGVGQMSPEYWPVLDKDGRASPDQLRKSFEKASNAAAVAGTAAQRRYNLKGPSATLLLSELAYHSGTSFTRLPAYRKVFEAKDLSSVGAAFKETPAYQVAGPERRKHYETLLINTLQGK